MYPQLFGNLPQTLWVIPPQFSWLKILAHDTHAAQLSGRSSQVDVPTPKKRSSAFAGAVGVSTKPPESLKANMLQGRCCLPNPQDRVFRSPKLGESAARGPPALLEQLKAPFGEVRAAGRWQFGPRGSRLHWLKYTVVFFKQLKLTS